MRDLYPRDAEVRTRLALGYQNQGLFNEGVAELEAALRLNPRSAPLRADLVRNYFNSGRPAEAHALLKETAAIGLDYLATRTTMFLMAYVSGDCVEMERHLEWLRTETSIRSGPARASAQRLQGMTKANAGQLTAARPFNVAKAKALYQEFFEMWKDADPDVPLLLEARDGYAALPQGPTSHAEPEA